MIVTFCGHRDFLGSEELKERMMGELLALAGQTETLFCYNGGYGGFDRFAAHCVKEAKKKAGNIRNILVISYLTVSVQAQLKECDGYFDEVIYPALENVPPKYAIIRRNEWSIKPTSSSPTSRTAGEAQRERTDMQSERGSRSLT